MANINSHRFASAPVSIAGVKDRLSLLVQEHSVNDLLDSPGFNQAVNSVCHRAENESDLAKIRDVFVPSGLFDRIQSPNSQLVIGRRGTGKTHLAKAFLEDEARHGSAVNYLDCRLLGTSSSDLVGVTSEITGIRYFLTLLEELAAKLWKNAEVIEDQNRSRGDEVQNILQDEVFDHVDKGVDELQEVKLNYGRISEALSLAFDLLKVDRYHLFLDEWSQVPLKAQPFLAEHLKRAILTTGRVTLKILAIEQQSRFSIELGGTTVGIERGADLTDTINLDQYLVWEENESGATAHFAQVLYNHLGVELGWALDASLDEKLEWVIRSMFTSEKAFVELVRAGEGNSRDFLLIFGKSYLDEYAKNPASGVSVEHVLDAAASWYEKEKEEIVRSDDASRTMLIYVVNDVLVGYKSRGFLVTVDDVDHPTLQNLVAKRVLHRLNKTYSNPNTPGMRYDIYAVDYGAFVRYRRKRDEPSKQIFLSDDHVRSLEPGDEQFVVPTTDKRSIRWIVFDPSQCEISDAVDKPDEATVV